MKTGTEIRNRVIKTELYEWRKLVELQPKNFKELTTINYEKLKQSILKENFVMSFTVWDSGKEIYIIDGHHRYKVLDLLEKDGINVPDKLPCTFIDCKDIKEAKKLVLTYSSIYSKVQEEGLYEFLNVNEFDFESLKNEIDIPNIDLELFSKGFLSGEYGTDFSLKDGDREPFQQMTFTLADEQAEFIKSQMKLIKEYPETYGNENSNGNRLYEIIRQWAEQRK